MENQIENQMDNQIENQRRKYMRCPNFKSKSFKQLLQFLFKKDIKNIIIKNNLNYMLPCYIWNSPLIQEEDIRENLKFLSLDEISKNQNLNEKLFLYLYEFIENNYKERIQDQYTYWAWDKIAIHPNITPLFLFQHLRKHHWKKCIHWIYSNPNITTDFLDKMKQEKQQILWNQVLQNPHINIKQLILSGKYNDDLKNQNMLIRITNKHTLSWNDVKKIGVDLFHTRDIAKYCFFSYNELNDFLNYLDLRKNYVFFKIEHIYELLSENVKIDKNFIYNNTLRPWNWYKLSKNPIFTIDDIISKKFLPWCIPSLYANSNFHFSDLPKIRSTFYCKSNSFFIPKCNVEELYDLVENFIENDDENENQEQKNIIIKRQKMLSKSLCAYGTILEKMDFRHLYPREILNYIKIMKIMIQIKRDQIQVRHLNWIYFFLTNFNFREKANQIANNKFLTFDILKNHTVFHEVVGMIYDLLQNPFHGEKLLIINRFMEKCFYKKKGNKIKKAKLMEQWWWHPNNRVCNHLRMKAFENSNMDMYGNYQNYQNYETDFLEI